MRRASDCWARAVALSAGLVAAVASGGKPVALGVPVEQEGVRVTLLSSGSLEGEALKGAAGGSRLLWLVEPAAKVPVLGDVRLIVRGKPYNTVTNAASSQPLAPDVLVHPYPEYAGANPVVLPAAVSTPRDGALVVEVLLRGAALPEGTDGVGGLELGLWATNSKKPRFTWFQSKTR